MFVYRNNIMNCKINREISFLHKVRRVLYMFGCLYLFFVVIADINPDKFLKVFFSSKNLNTI